MLQSEVKGNCLWCHLEIIGINLLVECSIGTRRLTHAQIEPLAVGNGPRRAAIGVALRRASMQTPTVIVNSLGHWLSIALQIPCCCRHTSMPSARHRVLDRCGARARFYAVLSPGCRPRTILVCCGAAPHCSHWRTIRLLCLFGPSPRARSVWR